MKMTHDLIYNPVLHAAVLAWIITQMIKFGVLCWRSGRLDYRFLFRAGGMPSAHSASIGSTCMAIGLIEGFDTSLFTLALITCFIVAYDAAGVRRQAGFQAERINAIINEVLQGHPLSEQTLNEVLGHTPLQVSAGLILGMGIACLIWLIEI